MVHCGLMPDVPSSLYERSGCGKHFLTQAFRREKKVKVLRKRDQILWSVPVASAYSRADE